VSGRLVAIAVVLGWTSVPAATELQSIRIGGEVRILGEYYVNAFPSPTGAEIRWPALFLPRRAIGTGPFNGGGIESWFRWDDHGDDLGVVTQWTRLHVQADFTNEVTAFFELDSVDEWGEDFRSDYVTGADGRAGSMDDVEVYQAYIQTENTFGLPVRVRVGRQELRLGSEWLVGANDSAPAPLYGLSFDAVRLTYATDLFTIDAWAAILAEGGIAEEDEDVWFYGVYGSYLGLDGITLDAYWMLLRDARSLNDTNFIAPIEWVEDALGLDDYDVTNVHTVGFRAAGEFGSFDFDAEAAYQWGEAGQVGFLFKPFQYGDDGAEYDVWGCNLEAGYTLAIPWEPRIYLGYAYLGGQDTRDLSAWDWLNPFERPEASVSFNRLFSDWYYSYIMDGSDMSNLHIVRAGIAAMPTERLEVGLDAVYLMADESFDAPAAISIGGSQVPVAPALSFWTTENGDHLGLELALYGVYQYSGDLSLEVGWAHLFVSDGFEEGGFSSANGLAFTGGSDGDDADYFYCETSLGF
jgi:Alginate export